MSCSTDRQTDSMWSSFMMFVLLVVLFSYRSCNIKKKLNFVGEYGRLFVVGFFFTKSLIRMIPSLCV